MAGCLITQFTTAHDFSRPIKLQNFKCCLQISCGTRLLTVNFNFENFRFFAKIQKIKIKTLIYLYRAVSLDHMVMFVEDAVMNLTCT